METQIELGSRLDLIPDSAAEILVADAQEVGRMINGLVRSLEDQPILRSSLEATNGPALSPEA